MRLGRAFLRIWWVVLVCGVLFAVVAPPRVAWAASSGESPRGEASGAAPSATAPATAASTPEASAAAPAAKATPPKLGRKDKPFYEELIPIGILIVAVLLVVWRLPRVDVGHSPEFRRRRATNWLPLGLTYAFLYMGRYNLNVLKDVGGISQEQYGSIFAVGAAVYGLAFLLNGPLTDRWGGRATILISAVGTVLSNLILGFVLMGKNPRSIDTNTYAAIYGLNMYFQSFGAVSIVKVNASWFHLRERGTFGGIFGILISLGLYFAFDWGMRIAKIAPESLEWLFFVPAIILTVFVVLDYLLVYDSPSQVGHRDFDPGDASSGDTSGREPALVVIKRMLSTRIILVIAFIELCSGFLRQGILQWYRDYAKGVGAHEAFVYENWGLVSCIAGITGGMFAGLISDHVFHSRRAPVSAVLYAFMLIGAAAIFGMLDTPYMVSWTIAFMAMSIIGVHGMLSGVASQDFGGKKNTGVAVGLIDGFVYLGSSAQSIVFGNLLPEKGTAAAKVIGNWTWWPGAMIPVAFVGLVLAASVWNARPQPKATTNP